jgi:hypothetical protein
MADDQVQVKFGAETSGMQAGVKQVADGVRNFSEQAKGQIAGVTATFGKLQEMMIGVAAIVAGGALFKDMVRATLEATGEVTKLQKSFGLTLEQANVTRTSLNMLGISTETYTSMANKLDMQLRRGSDSLKKMGLTAKDLDLGQKGVMDKAIATLASYKEGIDRNIAAQVLFGRGGAEANNLVKLTMAGVTEKARELEEALGLTVRPQDKENAIQYKIAVTQMGMAFEGIKKTIADAVLPYLTKFAQWFVSVMPTLIKGMKEGMAGFIEAAFDAAEGFVNFVVKVVTAVYNIYSAWQDVKDFFGGKANAGGVADFGEALAGLKNFRDRSIATIREIKAAVIANKPFDGATGLGAPIKGTKSAAGLIEDGGGAAGKDGISAAMKEADGEIRVLRASLDQKKVLLDQGVAQYRLTQDQKFAALERYTQQEFEAERSILQNQLAIGGLTLTQRQTILNKLKELESKHNADMIALDGQAVAAQIALWRGALSSIESSWNGQLRGLLAGTTSFKNAFKSILGDMVVNAVQYFTKMGVEWLAVQLGMTTATTTGAAARAAAEVAGAEATLPVRAAKFASDITANAGLVFAGIFASLAPVLGPAAAGPAGVGQASVLAELAAVPKLDVGTPMVLSDGFAQIHKGEAIVPASVNGAWQGGGGGPVLHLQFNANAAMSAKEIKQHARTIAQTVTEHWQNNPSTRPKN